MLLQIIPNEGDRSLRLRLAAVDVCWVHSPVVESNDYQLEQLE